VYKDADGLSLHFLQQLEKLYPLSKKEIEEMPESGKINKKELKELINKTEIGEALMALTPYFKDNNTFNALAFEFVSVPNNFNLAMFTMRLKFFIDQNVK